MTALVRARIGYAAGLAAACGGAWWEFGPGWALLGGGIATAASFLVLADTDERGASDQPAPPLPGP